METESHDNNFKKEEERRGETTTKYLLWWVDLLNSYNYDGLWPNYEANPNPCPQVIPEHLS